MSAIKYWLWLSTASKLPPRAKAVLLEHYGSPEAMFNAPNGEITRLLGSRGEGAEMLEKRDMAGALRIIDECAAQGIDIVTMQDAAYPSRLKNIYAPPHIIYVKGKLPNIDEEAAIAVIGTRGASPYGIKMARRLGYEISKCGGVVISGLTKGIDAAAAEGALLAGGTCIGVLGTPHEQCKGRLYEELAVRGALISEYPPKSPYCRNYFRARNRITSGLSVGVAVVEAPVKSGTRLFVDEASEQGKEIFAVPGNADSENCAGTNLMLKEGAKPVTNGWEIVCEFENLFPDKLHKSDETMPSGYKNNERENAKTEEKVSSSPKKTIDKPEKADYIDLVTQLKDLSESQMSIVACMDKPEVHVDDIIERTGFSPAKVLADLTLLQLKGYVSQQSGKRFSLNIKAK